MGKKKAAAKSNGIAAGEPEGASEPEEPKSEEDVDEGAHDDDDVGDEDAKVVKELEAVDEEYLAVEKELQAELAQIKQKYRPRMDAILEKRRAILSKLPSDDELAQLPKEIAETTKSNGSPNLPGFWGQVLVNSEELEEAIEDHDRPVLEYLSDVRAEWLDSTMKTGFRLIFKFAENPYFPHREILKTIHTEQRKFEAENFDVVRSVSDPLQIEWCAGKNVTVAEKADKKKKGNVKKLKPQPSFFRRMFRNLTPGSSLPEIYEGCDDSDNEDMDEDEIRGMLLSEDFDLGVALRDNIIPHAVRWYTKEALSDDDSDGDDDEDSEADEKIINEPWHKSSGGKAKGKGGKGRGK